MLKMFGWCFPPDVYHWQPLLPDTSMSVMSDDHVWWPCLALLSITGHKKREKTLCHLTRESEKNSLWRCLTCRFMSIKGLLPGGSGQGLYAVYVCVWACADCDSRRVNEATTGEIRESRANMGEGGEHLKPCLQAFIPLPSNCRA